ncbi:MAG: DUF4177 domain-containing protein [Roseburia sp.]|nr:DUF4177 domain-containing protein [Roseburia sp.]MCM1097124.1 DUF4177 domain-containing protein [Ruminococcus flavefaciens]
MKKYKILEVAWDRKHEKAEALMNEMAEEGWEVVCVSSNDPRSLNLLVTFCRDDSNQ